MSENIKLKRNIIVEAVFELRFDFKESADYVLMLGLLYNKLKEKYPEFKDMNVPDFGSEAPVEISYIPRNRMYSKDKKRLYSLGKGIITINTLDYSSFEEFLEEIMSVLKEHGEISGIKKINRIGLRYINKETTEKNISDIFTISHAIPELLKVKEKGFNLKSLIEFENDNSMELRFFKNPVINEYVLDFDFHCDKSKSYEDKIIREWVIQAHKDIYKSFRSCITDQFFEDLKSG